MKFPSILLFLLCFFYGNSFAEEIVYCPDQVVCQDNKCSAQPEKNHLLAQISSVAPTVPNGIYKFKGVNAQKMACNYRSDNGVWDIFIYSSGLIPFPTEGSKWVYSSGNYACTSNGYPKGCPMTTNNGAEHILGK